MITIDENNYREILHLGRTALDKYTAKGFTKDEGLEILVKNHNTRVLKQRYPREYRVFSNMKARCLNKNHPRYSRYGELGVCPAWKGKFGFLDFMYTVGPMPDYSANGERMKWSLDRIDNNKGYSPENCRWATAKTQARNTKRTFLYWNELRESGVSLSAFYGRIKRGWTSESAATTPTNRRRK